MIIQSRAASSRLGAEEQATLESWPRRADWDTQSIIIQEIDRVIARLREAGGMAILLVEQYYAFARELAQGIFVMDRGSVVLAGRADALDEEDVRGRMMV